MNEKEFINYFVNKRLAYGIKRCEFAKLLNISESYLSRIERNKRHLNFNLISQIAVILDIDLNIIKALKPNQIVIYD